MIAAGSLFSLRGMSHEALHKWYMLTSLGRQDCKVVRLRSVLPREQRANRD